jgi:hypothetical protein
MSAGNSHPQRVRWPPVLWRLGLKPHRQGSVSAGFAASWQQLARGSL